MRGCGAGQEASGAPPSPKATLTGAKKAFQAFGGLFGGESDTESEVDVSEAWESEQLEE